MLTEPECRGGYTYLQIQEIMGEREDEFLRWMAGQTLMICNQDPQRKWVDDADAPGGMRIEEVGPSLCDRPHGRVIYPSDVNRFLAGAPVLD